MPKNIRNILSKYSFTTQNLLIMSIYLTPWTEDDEKADMHFIYACERYMRKWLKL